MPVPYNCYPLFFACFCGKIKTTDRKENTLKKTLCFLTLLWLFLTISLCQASDDVYRTGYIGFDLKGKMRWRASTEIMRSPDGKENSYILTEKGEGIGGPRWKKEK